LAKYTKIFNEYFRSISKQVPAEIDGKKLKDDAGNDVLTTKFFRKPTISGLCVYAGISRSEFRKLEEEGDAIVREEIKKAKTVIEAYLEERLFEGNVVGIIFMLKNNFGWKDKTEQDITNKEPIRQIEIVVTDKTDGDRLQKLEDEIRSR
jgi:hypothetical protein